MPLFGSAARGDDRSESDIDILIDLDPAIVVTIFDYAGVKELSPACSTVRSMWSAAKA
jgi:predicted nucleotidyltransferase